MIFIICFIICLVCLLSYLCCKLFDYNEKRKKEKELNDIILTHKLGKYHKWGDIDNE